MILIIQWTTVYFVMWGRYKETSMSQINPKTRWNWSVWLSVICWPLLLSKVMLILFCDSLTAGCVEWPLGVYWGGGCPHWYPGLLHGFQCQEHHPSINRSTASFFSTTGSLKTEFWWSSINDPSSSVVASQQIFCHWFCFGMSNRSSSLCIVFIQTVSVWHLSYLCIYTDMIFVTSLSCWIWKKFCIFFGKIWQIYLDHVNK